MVATLTRLLARAGHEVAVAYGRRPETPEDLRRLMPDGTRLVPLPWQRGSLGGHLRAAASLRQLERSWRPHVVHLHSSYAGVVGASALPRRTPLVYTPHGYSLTRAEPPHRLLAYRLGERLVARRCVVGAVSAHEGSVARRELRAPRVCVVENGIEELDAPPPARPHGDGARAVAMGRIAPQRRPDETARILRSVADVAAVEWIGGAGGADAAAVRAAGVPLTGWLSREAALERLGRATAYLHWSAWDGQSLAVLEAMAKDVVVIASDIPANRELLGPAAVCRTPAEAAERLRAALERHDVRERLLDEQRARRGRWSARRMGAGWLEVYGALAEGAPQRVLIPATGHNPDAAWS